MSIVQAVLLIVSYQITQSLIKSYLLRNRSSYSLNKHRKLGETTLELAFTGTDEEAQELLKALENHFAKDADDV